MFFKDLSSLGFFFDLFYDFEFILFFFYFFGLVNWVILFRLNQETLKFLVFLSEFSLITLLCKQFLFSILRVGGGVNDRVLWILLVITEDFFKIMRDMRYFYQFCLWKFEIKINGFEVG